MTRLPDNGWRMRPALQQLARVLGADAGQTRLVGGAVRDSLLGLDVADIDLATRLSPETVMERLADAGIRAVPTGLAHGTVTAVTADGPVEVTTLRRDIATDGRHATVAPTQDWREDAARRDFTINALYADPLDGTVHDYFGGLADLDAGRVRFIGDPLQRIAEDHLRILRFFRFTARFGGMVDADGLESCVARANDLMALSRERIAAELLKLLVARDAVATIRLMVDRGVLTPVIPEIDGDGVARLTRLAAREADFGQAPDAIRRLAALLPAEPGVADGVAVRLKLSNAQRKRIAAAIGDPSPDPRALAYAIGMESAIDRLLIGAPDDALPAAHARLDGWQPPALPISGGALVGLGLDRGPQVAAALRRVETQWMAEGFPDAARVDAIARMVVDQLLRDSSKA